MKVWHIHTSLYESEQPEKGVRLALYRKVWHKYPDFDPNEDVEQEGKQLTITLRLSAWTDADGEFFEELYNSELINMWRAVEATS